VVEGGSENHGARIACCLLLCQSNYDVHIVSLWISNGIEAGFTSASACLRTGSLCWSIDDGNRVLRGCQSSAVASDLGRQFQGNVDHRLR
jgi:hypothetical protein